MTPRTEPSHVPEFERTEEKLRLLEEEVHRRTRRLRLLQGVAGIANEATSVDEAFHHALKLICEHNGWVAGQVFEVRDGGMGTPKIRHVANVPRADAIRRWLETRPFDPTKSLPANVVETGEARGVQELTEADSRDDAPVRKPGLRSIVWFPVLLQGRVEAVFECFATDPIDLDSDLLEILGHLGNYLSRVVERRDMKQRLMELAEEEQHRLGEEIHDTLGQQITGLGMLVKSLEKRLAKRGSPDAETARHLVSQIQAAHDQLRTLAKSLVPIQVEAGGLPRALEELAEHCRKLRGLQCRARIDSVDAKATHLPQPVATSLYRIAREAVHNASLHAEATRIDIRLRSTGDGVTLEIEDDGRGMEVVPLRKRDGLGLHLMQYRAERIGAELELESAPGQGTVVRCRVGSA